MKPNDLVTELEHGLEESQNQRDKRVEELWLKLDPQRTGELDLKGLRKGLRKIDHPMKNADDMLKAIMKMLDTNKDGKIQYEEFRVWIEHAERQLLYLFRSIDRDNDGKLDKNELQAAFRKAGLAVPVRRLTAFFSQIDMNNDGFISFDEWRDFLLFMPTHEDATPLQAVLSFYSSMVTLSAEGDSMVSEDTLEGLGYFLAGAIAGGVSRTATAPLDRLKVFLLVNTQNSGNAVMQALKRGQLGLALSSSTLPFRHAASDIYGAGGLRGFFAGNGLNVLKIMPETAIKFGTYEFGKRLMANVEGHDNPNGITSLSRFLAGGCAGMISQFFVYPLDTLKFRMQCETVKGGLKGNALIKSTWKKMWLQGGARSAYRGVTMGLVGMFPYSAIEMSTFELFKKFYKRRMAKALGKHEEDVQLPNFWAGLFGATSGAVGATAVYPLNVLRTRLQTQGTVMHKETYTGIWDVGVKTFQREGVRGMYKGLTPNLLKVAPAMSITWICYEGLKNVFNLH